jgi:hypothetical protein
MQTVSGETTKPPPTEQAPRGVSMEVKRPRREADHSSPSSAQGRNALTCTATQWSARLTLPRASTLQSKTTLYENILPIYCNVYRCCVAWLRPINTSTIPGLSLGNCSVKGFPRQRSRYCWNITLETVFSLWFVLKCYKQGQSCSGVGVVSSSVEWSDMKQLAGEWERFQLKACEEKTWCEMAASLGPS